MRNTFNPNLFQRARYLSYTIRRKKKRQRFFLCRPLFLKGSVNSNGDGKNRYPHRLLQLWWVLGMGKSPLLEFYCSIENREEAIEMESQGITKGHPFGCPLTHPHWGYSFGELFYRHPHSSPLEFTEPITKQIYVPLCFTNIQVEVGKRDLRNSRNYFQNHIGLVKIHPIWFHERI